MNFKSNKYLDFHKTLYNKHFKLFEKSFCWQYKLTVVENTKFIIRDLWAYSLSIHVHAINHAIIFKTIVKPRYGVLHIVTKIIKMSIWYIYIFFLNIISSKVVATTVQVTQQIEMSKTTVLQILSSNNNNNNNNNKRTPTIRPA